MKTHTIKTPTAELMIVELAEGTTHFSVLNTGDRIAVCAFDENDNCLDIKGISKEYTLIGKPYEIKEEDAAQLIPMCFDHEKTAVEYLIEIIESEIFWDVNPYEKPETCFMERFHTPSKSYEEFYLEWHEAEQKTFNRNRSIIFKKVTPKI